MKQEDGTGILHKLDSKDITYLHRKSDFAGIGGMAFAGVLVLVLSVLCAIGIPVLYGPYPDDIRLGGFCLFLCLISTLCWITIYAVIINRKLPDIIMRDMDSDWFQDFSTRSWPFRTLMAVSFVSVEIGREIYINWGLSVLSLAYIIFLSPFSTFLLLSPILIMDYGRMARIAGKIHK